MIVRSAAAAAAAALAFAAAAVAADPAVVAADPNKHFFTDEEWSELQIDLSHLAAGGGMGRQRRHAAAAEDEPYSPAAAGVRVRRQETQVWHEILLTLIVYLNIIRTSGNP